jgi:fused signal recognition particle receptor
MVDGLGADSTKLARLRPGAVHRPGAHPMPGVNRSGADVTDILLIVLAVLVVLLLLAGGGLLFVQRRRRPEQGGVGADVLERAPTEEELAEPEAPARPVEPVIDLPGAALEAPPAPPPAEVLSPRGRFRARLSRSRSALGRGLTGLFTRGADDEAWDELEEALLAADVGVATTTELVERLRQRAGAEKATEAAQLRTLLRDELLEVIGRDTDRSLSIEPDKAADKAADGDAAAGPAIVLVVGVNGTGKTTTVGKLALTLGQQGRSPVLAAADTFRAAATEQLVIWGERTGAPVIRQDQGADPAAVAFDALASAKARGSDVLLVDTAGRLHTKTNLMEELKKIRRVLEREGGRVSEVLLVLDATTGQNGLAQARQFTEAVGVTGLVLTKLDGTARGGIVIAVQRELGLPVKLVGLGEGPDDLAPFDPEAFVDAILDEPASDGAEPG